MLGAINSESERFTAGRYNILRIVAAFPLEADIFSPSGHVRRALKEDDHAAACLCHKALISTLTDIQGSKIVPMLKNAIKRPRDDADDSDRTLKKVKGKARKGTNTR